MVATGQPRATGPASAHSSAGGNAGGPLSDVGSSPNGPVTFSRPSVVGPVTRV
jgi:hypothetical protein